LEHFYAFKAFIKLGMTTPLSRLIFYDYGGKRFRMIVVINRNNRLIIDDNNFNNKFISIFVPF
jgi:hypothetical protein